MAGKIVRIKDKRISALIRAIRRKFAPRAIYLFGSRARGEEMNYSDWDFLVVSDRFEGISFRDRIDAVLELIKGPLGADVEPLCYTPEEFEYMRKRLTIVKQAVETGVLLGG